MKHLLCIMLVVFATGCATERGYFIKTRGWIGKYSDEMMFELGAPDRINTLQNGNLFAKMYTYQKKGNKVIRTRDLSGDLIETIYYCNTSYIVDKNEMIRKVEFQGNGCKASLF